MSTAVASGLRWRYQLDEPVIGVTVGPDGAVVGVGSEGRCVLLDPAGQLRHRWQFDDGPQVLATAPDGRRALVGGMTGHLMLDLDTGQAVAGAGRGWCAAAAWTPDGSAVAVGDGRTVRRLDRDGHELWTSAPLPSTVTGLAAMGDGRRVAAAAYQGVHVLAARDGSHEKTLPAPGAIAGLAVAPSGRWVVGGSQDATLHGWRFPTADDFRMSGFPTTVSRLAFHADGRWLACDGGNDVTCWDFAGAGPTGRAALILEGHEAQVGALAWAPPGGGPVLVTGDAAGTVHTWLIAGPGAKPGEVLSPQHRIAHDDVVTDLACGAGSLLVGTRGGLVAMYDLA